MCRTTVIALTALTLLGGALATALAPVPAAGVPAGAEAALSGVQQVAAGWQHSCAVMTDGTVRCWGENSSGQLGTGDLNHRPFPTTVRNPTNTGALQGVTQVSVGEFSTCAVLQSQEVRCWGANVEGQLGRPVGSYAALPVSVTSTTGSGRLDGVRSVDVGTNNACAVLIDRGVRCWGDDSGGALGNGLPNADSVVPVPVRNVSDTGDLGGVSQIAVGYEHACARLTSGQARCWGFNGDGSLGDGTGNSSSLPVTVKNPAGDGPLTAVAEVAVGFHSCARLTGGTVSCWGYGIEGGLGSGGYANSTLPRPVVRPSGSGTLGGVTRIASGSRATCAVVTGGELRCWGTNVNGTLGNGPDGEDIELTPVAVANPSDTGRLGGVTQLDLHADHVCARLGSGGARCWGHNLSGQLGNGGTTDRTLPVVVRSS